MSSSVHAKSLQLCPNLCDPLYCSLPGSSVHGIFQVGILEWVAVPSSTQGLSPSLFRPPALAGDINEWSESHSVVSDSCDPMDYIVHGILQAKILEWVAFPFSRFNSWLRNWTWVSCIAGRFVTHWAIREALFFLLIFIIYLTALSLSCSTWDLSHVNS